MDLTCVHNTVESGHYLYCTVYKRGHTVYRLVRTESEVYANHPLCWRTAQSRQSSDGFLNIVWSHDVVTLYVEPQFTTVYKRGHTLY